MRMETRSEPVRRAFSTVLRNIPAKDRNAIENFVSRVRGRTDYYREGPNLELVPLSAGLFPLWDLTDPKFEGAQIWIFHPVFRHFSREAQVGIVAHECAHCIDAIHVGTPWHAKMQARYAAGERFANRLARQWGFTRQIARKEQERKRLNRRHAW
jgi:hypothetical protein